MLGRPCGWRSSLVFVPANWKNLELAPVVALSVLGPLDGIVLDAEERPQPLRQFLLRLLHLRPGVEAVLIDLGTGVREASSSFHCWVGSPFLRLAMPIWVRNPLWLRKAPHTEFSNRSIEEGVGRGVSP